MGQRPGKRPQIYISNLPRSAKWWTVRRLFEDEVRRVTYVKVYTGFGERPIGHAEVEFVNQDYAQEALKTRWKLRGRCLEMKGSLGKWQPHETHEK